jgi:hypothetical protein
MGNDGGSLTNKRGILDSVSKGTAGARNNDGGTVSAAAAAQLRREERWRHCGLSRRPLWPPLVADRRGTLLRRDSALEFLLAKRTQDAAHPLMTDVNLAAFAHLRRLRDVAPLLFDAPRDVAQRVDDGDVDGTEKDAARLINCAVTGACGSSATAPFSFFWECGHVVSDAAVAAAASAAVAGDGDGGGSGVCPLCDKGVTRLAVVPPPAADGTPAVATAKRPRE